MLQTAAAWCGQVSGPGSDDDHLSVPAGQQDSLQVGYGGGEGHLMDDDYLPHHVVEVFLPAMWQLEPSLRELRQNISGFVFYGSDTFFSLEKGGR